MPAWRAVGLRSDSHSALRLLRRAARDKGLSGRFDETETKLIAEIDKRPEGLGDSVKSLIESLGLARAHAFYLKVRGLPAKNCQKCEDRRQWLNRFWPYH
jgi:hypothetical protein